MLLLDLIPIHSLTTKSDEKLNDIPEHDKGEPNKEAKGASKICNEGVPGVDEVLSQDSGTYRPIGESNTKDV